MSAYIVDRNHIRYLVSAAVQRKCFKGMSATKLGQMLWDECIKSVSYRYPGETTDTLPGPCGESFKYRHKVWVGEIEDNQLLESVKCYQYQSCEHPEWETSSAIEVCYKLKESLKNRGDSKVETVWGAPLEDSKAKA